MANKFAYISQSITRTTPRLLIASIFILACLLFLTNIPSKAELDLGEPAEEYGVNNFDFPQQDWQKVDHPNFKFWIYSAYGFENGQVVIIGTPKSFKNIRCSFYWEDTLSSHFETTKGKIERMKGWDVRWAGTFIRCPLPTTATINSPPTFVSVLLENQTESLVRLPIKYRTQHAEHLHKFAVCVLPLYGYNQVFHFIEWLEFYKLMGVTQFTFYNRSIGPRTSCIMNHYSSKLSDDDDDEGISVHVNPWHGYPQKKDADIRFGVGLSAGANECLYSHKGVSKYMIFLDVDEFIVPRQGIRDYHQLIEYLESNATSNKSKYGGFTFRNGFYFKTRDKDPELLERCSELRENEGALKACQRMWTMAYFQKEPLNSWRSRSKYIAVPDGAKNAGNHWVLEYEKGWKELRTSEMVAFSRHYRNPTSQKLARGFSVDRIPLGMGVELAKNVAASVKYFINVCNFSEADVYR